MIVLVALVFCPRELSAQAVRGTLLGNVTDQAGCRCRAATVTATEVNTNISATTVTNESGYYIFNMRDGVYRVDAELTGFKKTVREGMEVKVNTTIRVDLKIEVGVVEESMTVVGETPVLQTDRADTGRMIEGMQIQAGAARLQSQLPGHAGHGARARRDRSGRIRSSSTRRTASRPTSTASHASPTTCSSRASTTTTRPACSPC